MHNHKWYSETYLSSRQIYLSLKWSMSCFLGFLIHIILWVRTRFLAEVGWRCCTGFGEVVRSHTSWALNQMTKHCLNVLGKIKFDLWNFTEQTWINTLTFKFLEVFAEICHPSPLAVLQRSSPTSSFYFQLSDSFFFFFFPFERWNSVCFSRLIYGPWVKAKLWFKSRVLLTL